MADIPSNEAYRPTSIEVKKHHGNMMRIGGNIVFIAILAGVAGVVLLIQALANHSPLGNDLFTGLIFIGAGIYGFWVGWKNFLKAWVGYMELNKD